MENDFFDYDELGRNVDDLLNDEYGPHDDSFELHLDEKELPPESFRFRNAANGYGAEYSGNSEQIPSFDEEAAAMKYDPQTNSGAVIRAYNTDYASRAAQKANHEKPRSSKPAPRPAKPMEPRLSKPMESRQVKPTQPHPQQHRYAEDEEFEPAPIKKKKKHGFLKFLLVLLLLLAVVIAALLIFSKQPTGDSLGAHRDGCSAILLAGTDVEGVRTDTMMLLYVDQKSKEMNLLSLPRDTYTSMDTAVPKLNGVYGIAGGGKDGMERLMDYTQECIGYRPDGYVLVDLDCFSSLVDVMGGVKFDVPCDMEYEDPSQKLYIDLKAGEQRLNGKEAMWVVRYRSGYALADLQRVQVQRDFMKAALSQWLSLKNIWRAPAAATLLATNTTTDLSLRELSWFAKAAKAIGTDAMQTDTLPGEATYVGDGSYYVLWPETTAKLINEHYNPYENDVSYESIYSPIY